MEKKKSLLTAILVLFVSINPGARENIKSTEKFGPDNVRLINSSSMGMEFSPIEKTVTAFLKKWNIAGASMAISKDGKLVFARGFGYADTAKKEETQPFNKFRIASISKLITAVAIMKLNEAGKLSINDKVFGPEGILNDPYFDNPKDKRVYDITVAHLLSHESGWTQRYGDQMFMPTIIAEKMGVKPPVDLRTIIRYALDKNLHYTPGKGKAYSNLGYSILGMIVEKVSGMTYEEYCKKDVLGPLGIYDMEIAHNLQSEKAPMEVTYYEPFDMDLKPSLYDTGKMVPPCYGGNDIQTLGSAGGWIATAPDLMRLILAIDGFDTKPDILSQESIRLMTDSEAPVGWKGVILDGTWYRTGYFPGSTGMLKRQSDGFSWVVLFNSTSWKGPEIYSSINNMMGKVFTEVTSWPEQDLFKFSIPAPLKTTLTGFPVN